MPSRPSTVLRAENPGRIIAWIAPGAKRATSLRIMTRVGTASIQGTTVFIEDTADKALFLSWEGEVEVRADDGSVFRLTSGQCAEATPGAATSRRPFPPGLLPVAAGLAGGPCPGARGGPGAVQHRVGQICFFASNRLQQQHYS